MEQVESWIASGPLAQAAEALEKARSTGESDARWHFLRGMLAEKRGDAAGAIEAYQRALELNPEAERTMFRLAYNLDLRGEDAEEIRLYRACVDKVPTHVNALMNLAVLYEDHGDFDAAAQCLQDVLATYPNHSRARLFLKDVRSSMEMYYDENLDRSRERHNALLDIQVADFELSVRSRNCLKKMNVHTLGDLIMQTEADLLSYKNFGETSLAEIKEMLASKGLYLGMGLEQQAVKQPPKRPVAVETPAATSPVADILLETIDFSIRCRKCFQRLSLKTLGDLANVTEADLLNSKNFGQTSLNEVKQKLRRYGLSLKD